MSSCGYLLAFSCVWCLVRVRDDGWFVVLDCLVCVVLVRSGFGLLFVDWGLMLI